MVFGQMCERDGLSDFAIVLQSQQSKWYHLDIRIAISKSNLSRANENRDWRIYAEYCLDLNSQSNTNERRAK